MLVLCRYFAKRPKSIWTNQMQAPSLFASVSTLTATHFHLAIKTGSCTIASCCTRMYICRHFCDILYLFRFGRHTYCTGRVLRGGHVCTFTCIHTLCSPTRTALSPLTVCVCVCMLSLYVFGELLIAQHRDRASRGMRLTLVLTWRVRITNFVRW